MGCLPDNLCQKPLSTAQRRAAGTVSTSGFAAKQASSDPLRPSWVRVCAKAIFRLAETLLGRILAYLRFPVKEFVLRHTKIFQYSFLRREWLLVHYGNAS